MLMQRTRCDYAHSGSSGVFTGQSLTFAMAAAIALLTPFFKDHGIASTFWTEVTCHTQHIERQRLCLHVSLVDTVAMSIAIGLLIISGIFLFLLVCLFLEGFYMQLKSTGYGIWHGAYLLHTKTNR